MKKLIFTFLCLFVFVNLSFAQSQEDYDEIEGLGIFEVIEEDMALCEFVDVSKHNVQEILREGLELIRHS